MLDVPKLPRVTFGIIVLNGQPFTKYCLRSIYPFAHQIVVVEGGSRHAADMCTADGHSTDGTLAALREFRAKEDPENKLQIITRDGFWHEKDEQSKAFAERARGDYLWQIDIDEFYRPSDMARILAFLGRNPHISAVSFNTITFWGDIGYVVDSFHLRSGGRQFHRLFRFGPGYTYKTHRPPTVLDPSGRDLRKLNWVKGNEMARHGTHLYHCALLFPSQVRSKCRYYQSLSARYRSAADWAERCYIRLERPYHVHNVYHHASWLARFRGDHPPEVLRMMHDIRAGEVDMELRRTDDIERLLISRRYRAGRALLRALAPVYAGGLALWARRPTWTLRSYLRQWLGGGGGG